MRSLGHYLNAILKLVFPFRTHLEDEVVLEGSGMAATTTMSAGFHAKPIGRGVECPACSRYVGRSKPPLIGESSDKSLFICPCGWESKHA